MIYIFIYKYLYVYICMYTYHKVFKIIEKFGSVF